MRSRLLALTLTVLVPGTPTSVLRGDSLTVTTTAQLQPGPGSGLKVFHDNTDVCYVEDDTVDGNVLVASEALFKIHSVSFAGAPKAMRQTILELKAPNPNQPGCASGVAFVSALRCFHYIDSTGQVDSVRCFIRDNNCVEYPTAGPGIPRGQAKRLCVFWKGQTTGKVGLAIANATAACPTSASGYHTATAPNSLMVADHFRIGTPAINFFGANETITYYWDSALLHAAVPP